MNLRPKLAMAIIPFLLAACAQAGTAALPPDDASVPHWPWWLRVLAVIGALVFVQIVARTMRRSAGRRGPNSTDNP